MNWILRCAAFVFGLLSSGTLLAQSSPFVPMVPARLLDTRLGNTTVDGQFAGTGPVASLSTLNLTVSGRAGIPASGVGAVALNITVTDPGGSGYLTAWPTGTPVPNASNLNFTAGLSISNQVIAKIGANGQVSIFVYAGTGTANIIADVAGYFPTTSDFSPLTPARLLDTRAGMATIDGQFAGGGAIPGGGTLNLTVLGRGGVPASGVKAVVVNVTTANPTASIFVTAWPTGTALPNASNLNAVAGQTIPNLVIVAPGTGGKISLFNSAGSTDLIVDVVGYFSSNTTLSPLVPARLLDTRPGFATIDGQFSGQGAVGAGGTLNLTVLGRGGVPSAGVGAVALNITAVVPSAAGYVVAWGTGTTSGNFPPRAMDINFRAGDVIPSLVIAQVGPNGQVSLFNSNGSTHLLADVVAWFPSAGSGPPLPPASVAVSAATGSNSLTASWTLNAAGAAPTYLKIQRATNLAGPWTAVNGSYTPATSGQMAELVFTNATYYYGVAACNAAGCSAYTVSNPGAAISWIPAMPVSDAPVIASIPATDPVSDRVGATAAQFRVDESGNATYSIPIQAPPGTAGVAPKVALSYNSRLPNGLMGPGWAIEASSQISRCRQTRESGDFGQADGNPQPINFTASDRFCLDGVRLLLTDNSGNYGADNTIYSPETDPTTKVTARVSGSYAGPDFFIVQRKDGTTSTYGYMASSPNALATASLNGQNVAISWSLARTQDSKGNYIDYLYNSRPASGSLPFAAAAVETTLARISYTGHATAPVSSPYASISFSYAALPTTLVRLGYQSGVAFVQTQQLSSVAVTDASGMLRYYELAYQSSLSGSQFQQLRQVQECRDSSKAVCFAPTKFTWSAAQNTLQPGTKYQSQSGPNFTSFAGYKIADIDGDGRQDFVWAVNDNACGSGKSSIYVGFLDRTAGGEMTLSTAGQARTCAPINLSGNDQSWNLLDYDGDGRADLLIGGAIGSNWKVFSSLGRPVAGAAVFGSADLLATLASPIVVMSYNDPLGNASTAATGLLADLNGDGLPDFIYPTGGNRFSARFLTRQGSGLTFSSAYNLSYRVSDTTCTYANFPNASSLDCYISIFNTNSAVHRSAIAADVNGDGRADLTALVQAVTLREGCSTCGPATNRRNYWTQFVVSQITPPSGSTPGTVLLQERWWDTSFTLPDDNRKVYVADLNGDGLSDILYQDTTSATTYWALINNGRGYNTRISVDNISNGDLLQLADINGDGKTDLVYPVGSSPFSTYNYQSLVPTSATTEGWSFMSVPGTVPGGGLYGYSDWIALIGDFDGDGAPDYLGLSTTVSSNNVYTSRAGAGSRYRPRDVITDFTNGLGAITRVTYQPLTNIGVYQRGGINGYPALTGALDYGWASPVFDVLAPMYVVSQASSSAPTQADANAFSTVYYRYRGATMQSGGRGFLGFYETWSFDGNDGAATAQHVATINRYAQRYPITGMPIATLKQAVNGATVTRGSSQLDACAANAEAAGYNCFSGVVGNASAPDFQFPWPDILSAWGTVFSVGAQTPVCAGPGCLANINTNVCTLGGNGSQSMARPPDYTAGVFTGSSSVGPVFTYISYTQDATYDLATGSPAQRAIYALVENWFCYDGNGSTAGTGNLMGSRTLTTDGHGTASAEKVVANAYTDNASIWQLGRLTQSVVKFARPGQTSRSRTTSYTYDAGSGLLTSERIQTGGQSDQDLRTLYDLDAWGNRTAAYQCSANLTDGQCRTRSGVNQRQNGLTVLRYARTSYDAIGRYSTGSVLPFYSAAGAWNEQQVLSVGRRDEFGNPVQQKSINDSSGYTLNGIATTQWSQYGVLGRPYFTADGTGKAGTTTYRSCSGAEAVGCSSDTRFKFRSQTVTVGAPSSWTYYDVLGRPVLQVTRSYDGNDTTKQFSGVCAYTDAHNRTTYQSEPFFLPVAASTDGAPNLTASSASPCASATYATISTYDVIGRVVRLTQPDDSAISKTYSTLTTTTSSPRNAVWRWTQTTNVLGELVSTQDPQVTGDASVGLTVTQTYDVFGDVATIVRNAGSGDIVTSYSYDDLGRKISQSDPDSGTTYFSYNAAGEVIGQTDQKNQTIALSYDAQGRRWQRTTSNAADGNNLTDTWIYDTALNGYGQLASESRSGTSGATTSFSRGFAYDSYGRLRTRTTTIAGKDYPESTAYDGYGRLKAQQDISGHYVTPGYSANGYSASLIDSRIGTLYQLQTTTARG
ncbi:MAG: hypothetical protein IJI03_15460, partial [Rudaea sp.]|nr:hypothetical protein [Rudaea sp.]